METSLHLNSLYVATEGEGLLIGRPQIFVRTQGCSIGCVNCDSKDTWNFDDRSLVAVDTVIKSICNIVEHKKGPRRVSITGGDPLHPKILPGVLTLAKELKNLGFFISLEAAGTRIVPELFQVIDFINFDYKTPSTQVQTKKEFILEMVRNFPAKFQVKSVAADERDFNYTLDAYTWVLNEWREIEQREDLTKLKKSPLNSKALDNQLPFEWILTPVYNPGSEFPVKAFQSILQFNELAGGPFRVIGQQHKWVFGPNEKMV